MGVVGADGAFLIDEGVPCFVTDGADAVADGLGPLLHASVGPEDFAFLVGDADSLADSVEDEARLLGGHGTFEGEKVGGCGEDGIKLAAAKFAKGVVNGVGDGDVVLFFELVDEAALPGSGTGED